MYAQEPAGPALREICSSVYLFRIPTAPFRTLRCAELSPLWAFGPNERVAVGFSQQSAVSQAILRRSTVNAPESTGCRPLRV